MKNQMPGNRPILARFFRWISTQVLAAENSILDMLCAIVPYAVPIMPAYLTFIHTKKMMDFPDWVAWTAAFSVEALGMASVSTVIRFRRYNLRYKEEKNKAPFKLAIFTYLSYIIIVLVTNVILEIVANTRVFWVIFAIGLFSLLSFPSGILVAIRSQHNEALREHDEQRPHRRGEEPQPRGMGFPGTVRKYASDYMPEIRAALEEHYAKTGQVLLPRDVTAQLERQKIYLNHDKSKGFISTATKDWRREKGI